MSAIPRPHRDAQIGEIVLFYETGDPSDRGLPMMVEDSGTGWATLVGSQPGAINLMRRKYVKHIHDPFWDNATVQAKQSNGAYDFHPVYKGVFDRVLQAAAAREAARLQREAEKDQMTAEDFEALQALDEHGPNISAISKETGISAYRLNKMERFMEAFKAAKRDKKWREENEENVEQEVTAE